MEVSFREEFERSWLTSTLGLLIFGTSIYFLAWNEGRAVHHHHSLEETLTNAITLSPFDKLDPSLNGRVVHITGILKVKEPLSELDYGISIEAVKLKRRVQMYQWVEEYTSRNEDENDPMKQTTKDYYYVTEWRDKLVDSSSFYIRYGHENPKSIPLKTVTVLAPYVSVGPLLLSDDLKEKFTHMEEVTGDERPDRRDIKLHLGIYYHCQDVWNPEVGDIRVQFYYAGAAGEPVTVIAMQQDGFLVPFITTRGQTVSLVRNGELTVQEMFNVEHWESRLETWKFRLFGTFGIYFGVVCLSGLLKLAFNKVSFLSNIISGDANDFRNFFIAASVSLFVIAFAWMFHRPVIAASLIFAAVSPFLYCASGLFGAAHNM